MALSLPAVGLSLVVAVRYGSATSGAATVGSVLSELSVLAAAGFVGYRMRSGDDWARTLLAVMGGLVGLLVAITAITRFSGDGSMLAVFRSITSTVRLVQVSAVGLAIWMMFQPDAGAWFARRRRDG